MDRSEHLEWAKERALQELDHAEGHDVISNAFASIASDMNKHAETVNHAGVNLGMMMLASGQLDTKDKMRKFIDGFR